MEELGRWNSDMG